MKTKYLFGALMAVMATSCTAKTNEPAAPQSGKTMPDQSLLSAIRTNSGNSPCSVPSWGIFCPFFTKILQIYYIKFAFSFFFRNFVAYLRVLCLHVGASEYKERENND